MSELRKDPVLDRWVIIIPKRGVRPQEFYGDDAETEHPYSCPFCAGYEYMTPSEVFAIRDMGELNQPGWYVRVVPQKFPILGIEGTVDIKQVDLNSRMDGIGAHEIVIEHPEHDMDLAFCSQEQVIRVISAWRQRISDLLGDRRFRYVAVFRNHRKSAGASISHPHSQIVALPVIPPYILKMLSNSSRYYAENERCLFCDIIEDEIADGSRILFTTEHFVVFCPYASWFPYAVNICPLKHGHDLTSMDAAMQADLAQVLRRILMTLRSVLNNPPYNLNWQIAPSMEAETAENCCKQAADFFHWHISILPQFSTLSGFEWGTGFHVNPVAPEDAAQLLRDNLI